MGLKDINITPPTEPRKRTSFSDLRVGQPFVTGEYLFLLSFGGNGTRVGVVLGQKNGKDSGCQRPGDVVVFLGDETVEPVELDVTWRRSS